MKNYKVSSVALILFGLALFGTGCGKSDRAPERLTNEDIHAKASQQRPTERQELKAVSKAEANPSTSAERPASADSKTQAEVQAMVKTLEAGTARQKHQAITKLATMGKQGLPAVESLIEQLSDDRQIEVQLSGTPAVTTPSGFEVTGSDSVWGFATINEEALKALKGITGQDIGLDQSAWKAWYAGSRMSHDAQSKTSDSTIPTKFRGSWARKANGEKVVEELRIEAAKIEWTRSGEENDIVRKYSVADDGEAVSFDSKVTYGRAVFGGQAYKGDVKVRITAKDDTLILEIGGMKVQEEPGITVTSPPEQFRYEKLVPQK